jgi:cell division septation protein DedD
MLGISITSIGLIALLMTGASGLVMNPSHRRHAANVNLLGVRDSQPVALLPRQIKAERRSTRQKRCVRQSMSSESLTPTSSVANTDTPVNVAPAPTPDQTTTSSSEQQAQPTPDATPVTSGGSDGDTFTGQLT